MLTDRSLIVWPTCILIGLCLITGPGWAEGPEEPDGPELPQGVSSWEELGSLPAAMPVITMWNGGILMAGIDPYLLYAVWEDGTVMNRTPLPPPTGMKTPGDGLTVGRVGPERVQALLRECEQAGIFSPPAGGSRIGIDGPWLRLSVRHEGQEQVLDYHGRDEWEKPESGGPQAGQPSAEAEAFIKLWRETEDALLALTPTPRVGYNGPSPLDLPMAVDILGPRPIKAAQYVRKALPKGWTLKMTGRGFDVSRQEPVEWYNGLGLPTHDKEELKAKGYVRVAAYAIEVRIAPSFERKRLEEMRLANKAIRRRMRELDEKMAHIRGKGVYLPETPADQKLLDEFERQKFSLNRLPDVNTPEWSVYLRPSLGEDQVFYSSQVEEECTEVRKAIEAALTAEGKFE